MSAREEAADVEPSPPRRSVDVRDKRKCSPGLSPALIWAGVGGGICLIAGLIVLIVMMYCPSPSGVGATVARDDALKSKTILLPEETKPESGFNPPPDPCQGESIRIMPDLLRADLFQSAPRPMPGGISSGPEPGGHNVSTL